jgi:hypothetical protein
MPGQVHVVGRNLAGGDHALHFDDADLAGHGGRRVEVACRQVETQVARAVGDVCLDQRHLREQRAPSHRSRLELAQFLAVGHDGADTGLGEESRNARAAGAQLFGQRALGREFQRQLARQVLALELLVFADVDEIIFLIWRVSAACPGRKPSTPALLEMTVRSFTPLSRRASISASGMPHRPKPPTASSWPSATTP